MAGLHRGGRHDPTLTRTAIARRGTRPTLVLSRPIVKVGFYTDDDGINLGPDSDPANGFGLFTARELCPGDGLEVARSSGRCRPSVDASEGN